MKTLSLPALALACFAASSACAVPPEVAVEAELRRDPIRHGGILPSHSQNFDLVMEEVIARDIAAERAWSSLKTPAEREARRADLRRRFAEAVGGFPERTPLNVHAYGTVAREGYRVEKIVYESRPCHYVTALVFVPDDPKFKAPYPAVVVTCGHNPCGKNTTTNQRAPVILAKRGLVAMIFDPIDQGERQQLPGTKIWSVAGHTGLGLRAHLVGWSTAQFRIWDGIRALDVLCERPDVDAARVGVTGMSGGGTMSSYLNAMDGRYRAACPMGYITTMRALADRCGPQDAEQLVFGQLALGVNHLSLLLMNGKSAICPGYSRGDLFPYYGSRETQEKAEAVYAADGRADAISSFVCSGFHDWYESEQHALAAWMRYALADDRTAWPVDVPALRRLDVGFDYAKVDCALAMTPATDVLGGKGVMSLPGARSGYDFVRDELDRLEENRPRPTPEAVRRACGMSPATDCTAHVVRSDTRTEGALKIVTAVLERPDGILFPIHAFFPSQAKGSPVLIVDNGTGIDSADEITKPLADEKVGHLARKTGDFLAAGHPVAVATVRAFARAKAGYKRSSYWASKGFDQELAAYYVWLGKNLVALQAEDLLAAGAWFREQTSASAELVSEAGSVVAAAHAYYFGRDRFSAFTATEPPPSWTRFVREPGLADARLSDLVYGALKVYDWTDLVEHK